MAEENFKNKSQLKLIKNELESLKKIGYIFGSNLPIDKLLTHVVEEVCELLNADRGTLFLVDNSKNILWSKVALKSELTTIQLPIGKGIAGYVAKYGEIINIPDAYIDKRFNPEVDKATGYKTKSILCVPLRKPVVEKREQGEIIGVVQLLNKSHGKDFSESDEELLLSFGGSIASFINNAILFNQLEEKYREVELMYSTEHIIASNFKIDSLIGELISQFFNYLHIQAGGVIFQEDNNFRAFWKKNSSKNSPLISQNLLVLPSKMPFVLSESTTIVLNNDKSFEKLSEYYNNLGINAEKVVYIPLKSSENCFGSLQLIFDNKNQNIEIETKVWEILSSQIASSYELFNMRDGLIKNERLSLLGNMMSLIVHDLRSPLNNVIGYADLMTDEDTTQEERLEYQNIIKKEVSLMTNMTKEILDFAKGKTNILPGKVGIKDLCTTFKDKLHFDLESNQVQLQLSELPKGILWADKERLLRAFLNIAKNAIEAMNNQKREKHLKLWVVEREGNFKFHITDNGPGIPTKIQQNLFAEYVTSGKEGGTGLGLAIVKKIIEEHKGEIEFLTELNKGTEFIISIPGYDKVYN